MKLGAVIRREKVFIEHLWKQNCEQSQETREEGRQWDELSRLLIQSRPV